jgi:hypothetical protein
VSVHTEVLPHHPLLGRNVEHDDESLSYGAMGWPWSKIKSIEWTRRIPILDQSNLRAQGITLPTGEDSLGSCTGQELTGWLGTDNAWRPGLTELPTDRLPNNGQFGAPVLDELFAIDTYHRNTVRDSFDGTWPTDDTGSSGLASTKVAEKDYHQVHSYRHGFSIRQYATALQSTPLGWGSIWFDSMFEPRTDGRIEVVESSGVAGGHQFLVRQVDVENRRFWIDNSWNPSWGVNGRGYITWDDVEILRGHQLDVIARVPIQAATPVLLP